VASSNRNAAGESTVMLLPTCLWQDGVAVSGSTEVLAKVCPSVGNLGSTGVPALTLILRQAEPMGLFGWSRTGSVSCSVSFQMEVF